MYTLQSDRFWRSRVTLFLQYNTTIDLTGCLCTILTKNTSLSVQCVLPQTWPCEAFSSRDLTQCHVDGLPCLTRLNTSL